MMRIINQNRALTGSAPMTINMVFYPEVGRFDAFSGHLDAPAEIAYGGTRNITPDWDDLAIVTSETYRPGVLSHDY